MHLVIILLVIIILLLGGWWIFAVGIGLLLAAIGAVITGIVWLFQTFWPMILAIVCVLLGLGVIGLVGEATGRLKGRPRAKTVEPDSRPLPPISRTWAKRRADRGHQPD